MRKIVSLFIALTLILSNLSFILSNASAKTYDVDLEYPESHEQLLSEFFTSEEFIESIAQTLDIPKEILSNSDVVEGIIEETGLVRDILANATIVQSIAEIPTLVHDILQDNVVSNTIVEDSTLVSNIIQSDGVARIIAKDARFVHDLLAHDSIVKAIVEDPVLVNNLLKNEEVVHAIAQNPALVTKIVTNEQIIKAIVEDPVLLNDVLANEHVAQLYFNAEELVDVLSVNEHVVHALLNDNELLDGFLSDSDIAEEIKADLLTSYNDEMGAILGDEAQKIDATIQSLGSNGITFQLDVTTDEYTSTIIIDATLEGQQMTVRSIMDFGDEVKQANYEVHIVENTDDQFKAVLVDQHTGQQMTISDYEAHASSARVVVHLIGGAIKFISKETGKEISKSAAKYAKKTFSSGMAGEKYLATLVKVQQPQAYKRTDIGARLIDVLDTAGIAHESKVGYVTLTEFVKNQIDKDHLLVTGTTGDAKEIKGAKWHFFRSDKTGEVGASRAVLEYLKSKGIPYEIYD